VSGGARAARVEAQAATGRSRSVEWGVGQPLGRMAASAAPTPGPRRMLGIAAAIAGRVSSRNVPGVRARVLDSRRATVEPVGAACRSAMSSGWLQGPQARSAVACGGPWCGGAQWHAPREL